MTTEDFNNDIERRGNDRRPRRRVSMYEQDKNFRVRNILNFIFLPLAIIGMCVNYFTEYKQAGLIIMIVAVVIKFVEVSLRLFHK